MHEADRCSDDMWFDIPARNLHTREAVKQLPPVAIVDSTGLTAGAITATLLSDVNKQTNTRTLNNESTNEQHESDNLSK